MRVLEPTAKAALRHAPRPAPGRPRRSRGQALLAGLRPRQWIKNSLVLAAPAAGGALTDPDALAAVALAFVAFSLAASGGYLLNDVRDAETDRRHPVKRRRPVAAGELSPAAATGTGVALLAAGLAVAALVDVDLLLAVAGYCALTWAYTVRLKRIPILDIATVATFFAVRAVAGGLAVDVPLSRWFLIVAAFGSLFIVAGKRASEHLLLGEARASTRPALAAYSYGYLRNLRTTAASVTLAAYCLWAFEHAHATLMELSVIPFVLFVMRYAMLTEDEADAAPEDLVLGDPGLRAAGLVWAVVFLLGVYAG